jgi:hypothetical protein
VNFDQDCERACGCGGVFFMLYGVDVGLSAVMPGLEAGHPRLLLPWKLDVVDRDNPAMTESASR